MQIAPQSVGMAPPKPSIVAGKAYAYDVAHRNGVVSATLKGQDIAGVAVADVPMCPGGLAAAISSATGGEVVGMDMYGQMCMETLVAAGTSQYTFSRVLLAPEDAVWDNVFGLPYKWKSGGTVNTYTPSNGNGDPRGTVAPASAGDDIVLDYVADQAELHGQPLSERFASADFDTSTIVVTGTITVDGLATVTIPSAGASQVPCQINWGDGSIGFAMTNTSPTHQFTALWLSKYGRQINDAAQMSQVTTVDPLGQEFAPVYVQYSGAPGVVVVDDTPPTPDPGPIIPSIPANVFTTHNQADQWLDDFTEATGFDGDTLNWADLTLQKKYDAAKQLAASHS